MKLTIAFALLASLAFAQQDTKQRARTAHDLGKQGEEAIPKLLPYVSDNDISVRIEAVKSLDEIGGPKTVDPLVKLCVDPDPEIEIRATDGLINVYMPGYLKTGLSGTLQRVGTSIKAKFSGANDQVIDAYVEVHPEVIAALGKLVRTGAGTEARANAARAIGILRGHAAIPDLIEALHSKDDSVMFESLTAIEKIRDPSAAPRISFLLRDLEEKIQIAALQTTGILLNRDAEPDVRDVLQRTKSPKVKRAALTALAMLGTPADHAIFLGFLADKDDNMRSAASEGLGRIKNPSDRATLESTFKNEHKMGPRLATAFALVDLGNLDTSEFSPLRYLINTLNVRTYQGVALAYLTELARDLKVRLAIYPMLPRATKDEKIQLCTVFARAGDKDTVPYLETLSVDPDKDVAPEAIRSLRTLRARLP
ncbi:MAG TPA: HEAT repeat domain-containing protein [Bryobacteraceae bacterium]|nr:HEAT repeat domain-containing protein [Bryobacteraceae bacterium]